MYIPTTTHQLNAYFFFLAVTLGELVMLACHR